MAPPYRKAKSDVWIVLLCFAVGTVACIGYASRLDRKTAGMADFAIVCGISLTGLLMGMGIAFRRNRQRTDRIAEALNGVGYVASNKPTIDEKYRFFGPISHLETWIPLDGGAENLDWIAEGDGQIFEHSYQRGIGDDSQMIITTVACFRAGLTGKAMSLYRTRARPRDGEILDAGDAEFARHWTIYGDFELMPILTDSVRLELLRSPAGESWHIGAGWITCASEMKLNPEGVLEFVARTKHLAQQFSRSLEGID